MSKLTAVVAAFLLANIAVYPMWGQSRTDGRVSDAGRKRVVADFDARDSALPGGPAGFVREQGRATVERRRGTIESFLASPAAAGSGMRIAANRFGLPKTFFREGRALTAPSTAAPEEIARNFLRMHRALFPFTAPEVAGMRLVAKDASGSAVFLTLNQTLNGIDVFNGQIKFTLNAAGEVVHVGADEAVPDLSLSTNPRLSAEEAVIAAFETAGLAAPVLAAAATADGKTSFRNPRGGAFRPITAELAIFPMTADSARLAYRIYVEADSENWSEILIDAENGGLLYRHNLWVHAAQGRVWLQSPMDSDRKLVTFPDAWLPAGGTVTTGNNVDAYLDATGDDKPDNVTTGPMSGGRAQAADQLFDFPFGDGLSSQNPRNFQAAAVTNLFYLINTAHDYYYGLGFTEAAGNFQTDNFGKGGLANDAVLAEAQQPNNVNNASFAPTVDGTAPKIRMGLFTRGTSAQSDDLDSSYDGQVVLHEYGHGVSNRLVGARVSTSCLNGIQSGAMGEGWSDYFSISFYNNPVEGAYTTQNMQRGIRRQSYEGYQFTYEDIGNEGYEVHRDGEIWAATLWDLRKALGQSVTDLLVMNGLKSTPCHPSMTDARDGILAADLAANAGANRVKIWQAFARHGMGFSAAGTDGSGYPGIIYNAAYDQPVDLQPGGNPAITSRPSSNLPQMGSQYSYALAVSNPAAGTLVYAVTQGPPGMTIDSSGVLRWATAFTQQRVKVTVTDGKGGKVVHGFVLTPDTTLAAGAAVAIDGAKGGVGYANFTVPAGVTLMQVTFRNGTGDADLDLFDPNGINYWSSREGSNETLSVPTPRAGRWQIVGSGYQAFSGVSLTAWLPTPTPLVANAPVGGLSGVESSETFYKLTVPAGATSLKVFTAGGTGDVDLYLRKDKPAVCQGSSLVDGPCAYDKFSFNTDTNDESITVASPGAGDWYIDLSGYSDYAGATLTATLTVPPTLASTASTLTFSAAEGGTAPAAQTLTISDPSGSAFTWTTAVATAAGGNWLAISKTSGTGNTPLQVTADQKGMKPGTYQGTITVTAASLAGSPMSIGVTLTVTAQPVLSVAVAPLAFQAASGQNPPAQNLAIANTGGSAMSWTAAAATTAGGSWLKVSPGNGTGNASIQVSVTSASMAAGKYSGTITITAAGAASSPAVVPVSLTVAAAGPTISTGGIVGGGGSIPAVFTISPGGLATIYGSSFAPAGTARAVQAGDMVDGKLPTNLAGTCVQVDGKPAFLTFVGASQINFQVPDVTMDAQVTVMVMANCGTPNEQRGNLMPVRTAAASPEFLYWVKNGAGKDPVVAVNAVTGAYVGPAGLIPGLTFAPAKPGDILTIYGVSFGPTSPAFAPGEAPGTVGSTAAPPGVSMGAVTLGQADVLYAGVSPGIAGLYQLNIRVPANLPDGDHALTLTLGSFKTPSVGFVTVKAD